MKKTVSKEVARTVKFALFSASAGLIQAAVFTALNELTGWPYWPCYLSSVVISTLWNFTLNRRFTFKATNNVALAMVKVAAFYCVFTPVTTILEHLTKQEMSQVLHSRDRDLADALFRAARESRQQVQGNAIFAYGFVFFSTYCRNNCNFCYFRRDNAIDRYRKSEEDVLKLSKQLVDSGVIDCLPRALPHSEK